MASSYRLGSHFETFIKNQLASGRYANASEVIRAGLRMVEEHEESREARAMTRAEKLDWIRAEIQKGVDSGPAIPGDEAMARLHARAQERKLKRDQSVNFNTEQAA